MVKKQAISEQEFTRIRLAAVAKQIVDRDIKDQRVLSAMREVPRHKFLPPTVAGAMAYADKALPIGFGQSISQPYIVAYIAEKLELKGDEVVLEVGAGCGYFAAILGKLAKEVISTEIETELAKIGKTNLESLGFSNVQVRLGDASEGFMEGAPYDRIVVSAASTAISEKLLAQLNCPGRLIAPVGGKTRQMLTVYDKFMGDKGVPEISKRILLPVNFVPLRGKAVDEKT